MNKYKIIVSGGGTGGHIFPAISIANTLKQRFPEAEIRFVGADNRMEMERVPAAGYPIVGLPICGFDRAHLWKNIEVVRKLFKSLRMAKKIIREFRPDIAIGVGGYASGPLLWAAASAGIPTLIQEQNSYAGVTNKLLSKRASKICVAYEGMERFFPAEKIVLTGNPVRKDLEHGLEKREEAFGFFRLNPAKPTVLMIGGSLGARTMNTGMLHGLDDLIASGIQLIWQTGRYYYEDIKRQLVGKDTRGAALVFRLYIADGLCLCRCRPRRITGRRRYDIRAVSAQETGHSHPFSQRGGRSSDEKCVGRSRSTGSRSASR